MQKLRALAVGAVVAVSAFTAITVGTMSNSANAGDCDGNAVIYCGVRDISTLRTAYTANKNGTQSIFTHFGISSSMVKNSRAVSGSVTKDGNIIVDGKVVAKGAVTAGRQYMPGSTTVKLSDVTIYKRTPSVSFLNSSLPAIVFYNADGTVSKAVIAACGNPVTATPVVVTPPKVPVYTCDALTPAKIDRTTYDFTVAYTAKDGATFKNYTINYGDGVVATGQTAAKTRHQYKAPGTYTVTTTIFFNVGGVVKSMDCVKKITVEEPPIVVPPKTPVYKCDSLKPAKIDRTTYDFTVAYTAKDGATFKNYTLDLGNGVIKTGLTNLTYRATYAEAKSYTVKATVYFMVDGVEKSNQCTASVVTVAETPVYACDLLEVTKNSRTSFTFEPKVSVGGGATMKSYDLVLGDGTSKQSLTAPFTYEYSTEGTYTVKATVTFNAGSSTGTDTCEASVTVAPKPVENKPSVTIEKMVNDEKSAMVAVGEEFIYTLKVVNTGNVALKSAVVSDAAPDGVTFKRADTGSIVDNKFTATTDLAVGASKTFKITAVINTYKEGNSINQACVDVAEIDGSKDACDTATVTVKKPVVIVNDLTVCIIASKTEKTIKETEFDASTMTKDLSKCQTPTEPKQIKVCIVADKTVKWINETEYDANTMSKSTENCVSTPVTPEKPNKPTPVVELPKTGVADMIGGGIGLSTLAGAAYYYTDSRRRVAEMLNRK